MDDHQAIQQVPRVIYTYNLNTNDLDFWSGAWEDAGWKVQVLSNDDALKNYWSRQTFELLKSENLEDFHSTATLPLSAFLAMNVNGGYYADSTILPLRPLKDGKTITLPNHGRFTATKIFDDDSFLLLSGSRDEWYRMLLALINNRNIAPSNALEEIYDDKPHAFYYNSNQEIDSSSINNIVNINDYKDYKDDFDLCEKLKYAFGVYVPNDYADMEINSKEEQLYFLQSWYNSYKERCW